MLRAYIGLAASILITAQPAASNGATRIGTFEIGKRPITVSREKLRASPAKSRAHGCARAVRVLALINERFSAGSIEELGWRRVSSVGDVATLQGCADAAPYLTAIDGIEYVKMPNRVYSLIDSARKAVRVDGLHDGTVEGLDRAYTGRGVLIGIIDTEFDTHHPAFLDAAGTTRFIALWDQTDSSKASANSFGYGTIKNQSQLASDPSFGLAPDRPSHGTIAISLAAGSDRSTPYYGIAPEAMIAAVKRSGADNDIIDGAKWISALADSLDVPCVVNMSIGHQAGPHDGTSLVDRAIDSLSGAGRIVVGAAGNDGDKRAHAGFLLAQNEVKGTWVSPKASSSESSSHEALSGIDMWGDSGKSIVADFFILDTTTMEYRQSTQTLSTSFNTLYEPDTIVWPNHSGDPDTVIFAALLERRNPLNNKPHLQAVTASTSGRLFLGVKISVERRGGTAHAWNVSKRSLRSFGLDGFIDGDNDYSVNEVGGTARRNITVGSYISRQSLPLWDGSRFGPEIDTLRDLAGYSSRGPTVDGRTKPDITAPGSEVVGAASRAAPVDEEATVLWPNRPDRDSRYAYSGGTSLSAPIVAGIAALMLEADPGLTPEQIRETLQATAITDSYTGPLQSPDNRWGAGKVDALGAIARIVGVTAAAAPRAASDRQRIVTVGGNVVKVTGGSGTSELSQIEIHDLQGRRAAVCPLNEEGTTVVPDLSAGTYLIGIRDHKLSVRLYRVVECR